MTRDEMLKKRDDWWWSMRVSPLALAHPADCEHPHGLEQQIGNAYGPLAKGCGLCGWLKRWDA